MDDTQHQREGGGKLKETQRVELQHYNNSHCEFCIKLSMQPLLEPFTHESPFVCIVL